MVWAGNDLTVSGIFSGSLELIHRRMVLPFVSNHSTHFFPAVASPTNGVACHHRSFSGSAGHHPLLYFISGQLGCGRTPGHLAASGRDRLWGGIGLGEKLWGRHLEYPRSAVALGYGGWHRLGFPILPSLCGRRIFFFRIRHLSGFLFQPCSHLSGVGFSKGGGNYGSRRVD